MTSGKTPTGGMRWARLAGLLCMYAGIFAIGHWGGSWLGGHLLPEPGTPFSGEILTVLALSFALYVVLLALPFVPGMEVSLAILAALGGRAAVPIYLATIAALVIAFAAGRLVPMRTLASVFDYLGLVNARDHVLRLEPMTRQARIETLTSAVPSRIVPFLIKNRYLAVAVALNTPGNAVIGGGGGIAMLAGLSGLFAFPLYLATLCVAAAPIPLAIWLAGKLW